MPSANKTMVYTNAIIGSKPKCDFWLKVLDEIKLEAPWWCRISKNLKVFYTTGPNFLTSMIRKYYNEYSFVELPKSLNNCCVCDNFQECGKNQLARPLEGSSWHNWDGWIMNTSYCYSRSILLGILAFLLLIYLTYQSTLHI